MDASCLCSAIRYRIDGPFEQMLHCHCSMCRKHHGTAFMTAAAARLDGFRWISGPEGLESYASSARGSRVFCSRCGAVGPQLLEHAGMVLCPAGNLAGDPGIRPQAHMFVKSKAPWYSITDTLPQHDEYPPEFRTHGVANVPRQSLSGNVEGSCLCGGVGYEAHGEPLRMVHCHCSRCRLSRSAAHATNLFYADRNFRWTRGGKHIREYKVPEARYFTVAFCTVCGGKVPRISPERGLVVIPAGSIDTDVPLRPQAHIYVASKAPWFEITDNLPQYPEGPPLQSQTSATPR